MTAKGERKSMKASWKRLLGCHGASESTTEHLRKHGGGEPRSSVQTDSPAATQMFKNPRKLKTAKQLLVSMSDIF